MNLNYVAGLFDGEGYVYIFKKVKRNHIGYYVCTGIGMCYKPIIVTLHQNFGGHINASQHKNPKHRTQFMWGLVNQQAAKFLRQIQPYSVVKQAEIDLALELQDHIDQNPYNFKGRGYGGNRKDREGILAYREELLIKCKALKTQTFSPLLDKSPMDQ